jgi:hypothetical protein
VPLTAAARGPDPSPGWDCEGSVEFETLLFASKGVGENPTTCQSGHEVALRVLLLLPLLPLLFVVRLLLLLKLSSAGSAFSESGGWTGACPLLLRLPANVTDPSLLFEVLLLLLSTCS